MKEPDLLCMRFIEDTDRFRGRLQQDLAALFRKIRFSLGRQPHITHLTRTNNELLASLLEDKLRFVCR